MVAGYPDVRRIMLTGYADLPELISLKNLDLVVAVLMKPWERADMEHALSLALRAVGGRNQGEVAAR
jgi:hypothetical protein